MIEQNNKSVITDLLNNELLNWREFQSANKYSGQTFYVASGERYFIRANVWTPPQSSSGLEDWEQEMFAYEVPHDHNFSFMTGGYYGVGYETSIYEYDGLNVEGVAGEKTSIQFLESTNLSPGKIMFYRASRDIHTQRPPTDLSISLNLMYFPKILDQLQYSFDLENSCINEPLKLGYGSYESICAIASQIGDSYTSQLLLDIQESSDNPGIRAEALRAFAYLEPRDAARNAKKWADDSALVVRRVAQGILCP